MKDWKRTVRLEVRTTLQRRALRQEINASSDNIFIFVTTFADNRIQNVSETHEYFCHVV
jgi:hypothetical protein